MPFSSTGVYTPAAGALTAVPGAIIKSSVWNAIFTDMTAAFTQVAQSRFLLNTLTAATSATLGDTTSLTSTFKDYEIVFENLIAELRLLILSFKFILVVRFKLLLILVVLLELMQLLLFLVMQLQHIFL